LSSSQNRNWLPYWQLSTIPSWRSEQNSSAEEGCVRISWERRKNTVRQYSEMPHWVNDPEAPLDDEMKRRLAIKDNAKQQKETTK